MFSYYGSKSKIIHLYPSPQYPKIIEPFAGSARYALKYWDRDVLLVDKYEVIVKVWHFLQAASPADILGLPDLKCGQIVPDTLSEGERLLMGFLIAGGNATTRYKVASFDGIDVARDLKRIAKELPKIKHWEIRLGSYEEVPNQEATWFIDPPYQVGGHKYKFGNKGFDFCTLSQWSQSRQGQVIVCENTKADWLPFWPIGNLSGAYSKTTEAIWSNQVTQLQLFTD